MISAPTIRVHAALADAEQDLETPGLAGYAFGRFAWLQAWRATLGAGAAIGVAIVVVADPAVRMVLPLGVHRRGGLRILEFLGAPVTDYNAPLVDPDFAASVDAAGMEALWARILSALPPHDIVRLLAMPDSLDTPAGAGSAPVPNPLTRLLGTRLVGLARSRRLPRSHEALVGSLKGKFVTDTVRRRRRLGDVGPVSLRVAGDDAQMVDVLSALHRMKSRRWAETGSRDWFRDPGFAGFYAAMSRLSLPEGRVHGTLLKVGDTAVAAHLGLVYRDRFYMLLVGWEANQWRRYSTGRLIVDALMRCAIDDGVAAFDFTSGDERYKRDWTDTEMPLLGLERATSRRGAVALTAMRAARRIRARAKQVGWLRVAVRRVAGRPDLKRRSAGPN